MVVTNRSRVAKNRNFKKQWENLCAPRNPRIQKTIKKKNVSENAEMRVLTSALNNSVIKREKNVAKISILTHAWISKPLASRL